MTRLSIVLSCLVLASVSAAQRIWVVDVNRGAGYHFTNIQSAVDRAGFGDRIRVRAGSYPVFTVSKAVHIVGERGVSVRSLYLPIQVVGLGAGQTVTLQNFDMFTVEVKNCAGRVLCDSVRGWAYRFLNSKHVAIAATRIYGLLAKDSTVSLTNSDINAATTGQSGAVTLQNSLATIAGCTITGGQFYTFATSAIGIDLTSALQLTGTTASFVRTSPAHKAQPGLATIAGRGVLILDPRVRVQSTTNVPIGRTVKVTRRTVPFVDARGGPLGGRVNVTMHAGARQPFFLAVGLPGAPQGIPALGGAVFLDLRTSVLIGTGRLDANGKYAWSIPVPQDNQLLGVGLVWQGTAGPSLSQQFLSNPSAYVHGL